MLSHSVSLARDLWVLALLREKGRKEGRNIRKERKKGGKNECFCSCMHNLSNEHESVSLWGLFHSICPTFFCAGGGSCAGEGATEVQTPPMTRTTKRMKTKAEVDIAIFWESSIETRTQTCKMFWYWMYSFIFWKSTRAVNNGRG